MKTGSTIVITFSPTHASKRVAKAVAQGADCNGGCGMREIDLTHTEKCDCRLPADAFAVISAPVYGGHIPPTALERMSGIRADGTPAAIIVTYGNRAHEEALPRLYEFVTAAGFRVIAEGAFIGEHSYCTDEYHIAAGRPDADDIAFAMEFGRKIREKMESFPDSGSIRTVSPQDFPPETTDADITAAFRKELGEVLHSKPVPPAPATDGNLCIGCGECVSLCPTGAIAAGDELHTDPHKCIRCCACVKGCPQHARSYDTPFSEMLSKYFSARRKNTVML